MRCSLWTVPRTTAMRRRWRSRPGRVLRSVATFALSLSLAGAAGANGEEAIWAPPANNPDGLRLTLLSSTPELDPFSQIDRINVYQASLEAMRRALQGLDAAPDFVLVDGRGVPGIETPHEVIVRGDATCHAIAAASILAKTARDALMVDYDQTYPGYGFASH